MIIRFSGEEQLIVAQESAASFEIAARLEQRTGMTGGRGKSMLHPNKNSAAVPHTRP